MSQITSPQSYGSTRRIVFEVPGLIDFLREQAHQNHRYQVILEAIAHLGDIMGQNHDALVSSIVKLETDVADVPNRLAALEKVLTDQIAARDATIADQAAQLTVKDATIMDLQTRLDAALGEAVTAEDNTRVGTIDGTLNTALPPAAT